MAVSSISVPFLSTGPLTRGFFIEHRDDIQWTCVHVSEKGAKRSKREGKGKREGKRRGTGEGERTPSPLIEV